MVDSIDNSLSSLLSSVTGSRSGSASNELGKDAFLELMVAQMSNQNPLEPMDSTQFLSQLAQFSALEQMQNVATGMNLLALTQTAATNSQMVNLIGKRVIVSGDTVTWDGSHPAEIRFELASAASVRVEVMDADGTVVRHIAAEEMQAGVNGVTFDGLDDSGNRLAAGNYTYKLVGGDGQELADATRFANYLVDAVAFDGSDVLLKSRGLTISLADVSEVILNG